MAAAARTFELFDATVARRAFVDLVREDADHDPVFAAAHLDRTDLGARERRVGMDQQLGP